jgi:hypothetical protein
VNHGLMRVMTRVMTAGQLVPEGYGVWWLVLHYKPAVVQPLKTQTGTLSEVKPVIK